MTFFPFLNNFNSSFLKNTIFINFTNNNNFIFKRYLNYFLILINNISNNSDFVKNRETMKVKDNDHVNFLNL